jgi:hypothetical protein
MYFDGWGPESDDYTQVTFSVTPSADSSAAAVPVPAAAWTGLSVLVGTGALGMFRKRAKQA